VSQKLKILLVSKDLRFEGGVYDFVSMLLNQTYDSIECEYFPVGDRFPGKISILKLVWPLIDNFRLPTRLLRGDINCLHLNPSMNFTSFLRDSLLFMTARTVGFRNILVFFHGWDEDFVSRIASNALYRFILRCGFSRASVIFVLSETFKSQLISMGVPGETISIGSTMFDSKIFDRIARAKEVNMLRLLFLSRFIKGKGVFELLDAFRQVHSRFPNTELVMAGDGPERSLMEEYVRQHNLTGVVKFTGYLRGLDKGDILMNSDIFILPSYGEGLPIVLLEAMAAGLPIICTSVGGITDIFENGKNGILLSSVSAKRINEAVSTMIENREWRIEIGCHNRMIAWEYYEASSVLQRMKAAYWKIVETSR
jgi:glycosyltransferase involved in cell wall biosynthesis